MSNKHPSRLRREDSFFGIHFDFHARSYHENIGATTDRAMIEAVIRKVKPDFIQIDCKGHNGYSSYPTKAGNASPHLVKDTLRLWREVTEEHGVGLFMHYSGVYDKRAIELNPSWGRVKENGEIDPLYTSVFSPYLDKLMLPQLKELADEYEVDGVWVDGECWAVMPDYAEETQRLFMEETGIRDIPRKPGEPYFYEWMEFVREGFRQYLRTYVDAMHAHRPGFQVISNAAFSSRMPEPVTIDVDALSGDYALQDSYNSARFESRCLALQGKPWDLMAWGFTSKMGEGAEDGYGSCSTVKSAVQLNQELSAVLAVGGGVQVYFTQNKDGSVNLPELDVMEEVGRFLRERQELCHKAETVPQIALLFSTYNHYRQKTMRPLSLDGLTEIHGTLQALLDGQHCVDIVQEHSLRSRLNDYRLVIVPEVEAFDPSFAAELLAYVAEGGRLLALGPNTASYFQEALDIRFEGDMSDKKRTFLHHDGRSCGVYTRSRQAVPGSRPQLYGELYERAQAGFPSIPAASIAPYGKGRIAGVYFQYGERYLNARTALSCDFLRDLAGELFPDPLVKVTGSRYVDVSLTRKSGKLIVHLNNASGPHADRKVYTYDELQPVGPLQVAVRTGARPSSVRLEPRGVDLPFSFAGGTATLTVDRVDIHEMIVMEQA